jgi:hypothetical protein
VALFATLAIILLVNPVGFIGGGWDDWQYLNAARCWVESGPCLPRDHWQGRWPIVAPLAASIALLGESRFSVGLPSFLYAIGCLALVVRIGNRVAGPPVGWIAALLLLVMPMFAVELLDPNVEHPELFFLLASAAFLVEYRDRPSPWLAFAAGLAWSLAFQVRETAIVALPLLAWAAWRLAGRDLRAWSAAAIGMAIPAMVELLAFWLATGDPLWRRGLSVAHTRIPSTELLGPIDYSRPPFFNPNYIANWRHEPGFGLHWSIDGLANLIVNAKAGITIPLALTLALTFGRRLPQPHRHMVLTLLLIALYWACVLIYALAIDPKARMMFTPVLLSAFAVAILLRDRWNNGSRLLAAVSLTMAWLAGLSILAVHQQIRTSEPRAVEWLKRYPEMIETDLNTTRHLALLPAIRNVPLLQADRPLLLIRLDMHCDDWTTRFMPDELELLATSPLSKLERLQRGMGGGLCLFRYRRPVAPNEIIEAKARAVSSPKRSPLDYWKADRN